MINANLSFEIQAEAFYRMTRQMAPGKSTPIGYSISREERLELWENWQKENKEIIHAFMGAINELIGDDNG